MSDDYIHAGKSLTFEAQIVPWDTAAYGFPIAVITSLVVDRSAPRPDLPSSWHEWLAANDVQLVSCRLQSDRLRDSFLLEANNFRFIETVLHPFTQLPRLPRSDLATDGDGDLGRIDVHDAAADEVPLLIDIARTSFGFERFHSDPRLTNDAADARYANWVAATPENPSQRLLSITRRGEVIGVFIVQNLADGGVYWHLTAIGEEHQGHGTGLATWRSMLEFHERSGATSVSTTIAATNVAVLNLYAKLAFRFRPPEMTFHWYRDGR
jgi:RimJ/RimL family protein N-acetyltransferase